MSLMGASEAQAQWLLQISAQKRSMTVPVFIGKSEDVRTDTSFVEITVGDQSTSNTQAASSPSNNPVK